MDYNVKAGDCLYSILKQQGIKESEISGKINQIAKLNNLKDPNLIFEGQKLNLGDDFKTSNVQVAGEKDTAGGSKSKAKGQSQTLDFSSWLKKCIGASVKNGNFDASQGDSVEEFKMFNFDSKVTPDKYAEKLNQFAKDNIINLYDKNKDGKLSEDEFVAMELKYANDSATAKQAEQMAKENFKKIDLDGDKSSLSSEEFATQFMMADLKKVNGKAQFDGKFKFSEYVTSVQDKEAQNTKQKFFDKFFKRNAN